MSHRTIRKHPHEDWKKWQAAGLRFSVDRDFVAEPFTKERIDYGRLPGWPTRPTSPMRSIGLPKATRMTTT